MQDARIAHVKEVVRAAERTSLARDPIIQESWRRCLDTHRLDPTVHRRAYIHTDARLREHQEAMEGFLHVARFGVESLYRQVSGLGYVLLLTDSKGVAVDFMGASSHKYDLIRAGLYGGSDWSEGLAGTCGVGTCIETGKALTVHQTDHFDVTHIPLTCTTAPMFAPDGSLVAALDISALRSPDSKLSQYLALQMVKSYAHKIENANLLNNFRSEWILQLSRSQEFADVDPEYLLAVGASGTIVGFNNHAREMINSELGISDYSLRFGRDATKVASFSDLFDADFDDLPNFTRARPAGQRGILLRRSGATLFALAQRPPEPPRRGAIGQLGSVIPGPLSAMSGGDPVMDEVVRKSARIINSGLSILIQGPTGTGKEHLAKALHKSSLRSEKPFIPVNCAALPEHLIESELFGYEAGSFTGAASRGKRGLILEADGGTLFLDEIGDMPLLAQTRLLRVLSEREVMPVGRTRPVPVNIRVISATHCDVLTLIKGGRFREDLYFRLNGVVLTLPPLRCRADFDWLVDSILAQKAAGEGTKAAPLPVVTPRARVALRAYPWPGNVRELRNALDYAIAFGASAEIDCDDLPEHILSAADGSALQTAPEDPPTSDFLPVDLRARELIAALRARQWNVSAVARDLGIDRSTIHRQMHRFAIKSPKQHDI